MASALLAGLNEAQEAAVRHESGPLLILAGAGTGKTRTITRRVAWLVDECRVPSSRMLAITFTNKAAAEMRSRIAEWVPDARMWVGTFHATCARMLRMDPEPVGRSSDFTIFDQDDKRKLLRNLIKDAGMDPQVFRPARFEGLISGWKHRRIVPAGAAQEAELRGLEEQRAAQVYAAYEQALARSDALDFDDLLWKGLLLLQQDAHERWTGRFEHVLVDEYQDTNEIQYEFVRRLAARTRNLAVCGDPDQSIYSWRGADVRNILRFDEDFPDAAVIKLERNYRSVGNVLKAAQAVIRRNRARKEKELWTEREAGPPLGLAEAPDEEIEANVAAMQMARWIAAGTSPREVAVFYRTNACSRALEAACTRLRIPYQVVGGLGFFERREIKDLLAYARLAANPRDDAACARALNVPPRGIGETTVERLRAVAGEHGQSLVEALRRDDFRANLRGPARKGVNDFIAILERLKDRGATAEGALRAAIDCTGYRRYAEALEATEDVDRGENIDELLAFAHEYDQREDGGLRGFLAEIALLSDVDQWDEQAERVSLMTVHAAKGLEFDRVAVVGLEEGLFPHGRALEEGPDGLEEERRLFYVALTRAREEIHLSHCRMRFRTGAPGPQAPSRFLDELPPELLPGAGFAQDLRPVRSRARAGDFLQPASAATEVEIEDAPEFEPGDRVLHRVFGAGTVIEMLGHGVNRRIVVEFDGSHAQRTLLLAYSMLEREA
jgi:DNA helicase-2/ATP-dependent DNA helicase PcrA